MIRAYYREAYIYAELWRVARYLMSENIDDAGIHFDMPAELISAASKSYSVVQLKFQERHGSNVYIVFHNNTRYTTNTVPSDYKGDIEEFTIFSNRKRAIRRFKSIARYFKMISPEMYNKYNINTFVDKVLRWVDRNSDELDFSVILRECMSQVTISGTGYDMIDNAIEISRTFDKKFFSCEIEGTEYQKGSALLNFFAVHPYKNQIKLSINNFVDLASLKTLAGEQKFIFVPGFDINFYLSSPTSDGTCFYAARGASRLLRRNASAAVQAALESITIGDFHARLFQALGYYRGAFEILSKFKFLEEKVPGIFKEIGFDLEDLHKWWVECEEARVTICVSLREAAISKNANWNISKPEMLIYHVINLYEDEGANQARNIVKDFCLRLYYPHIIRDLLLCVIAAEENKNLDRWIKTIINTIEKLEYSHAKAVIIGDPAYLFYAYSIAIRISQRLGRADLEKTFSDKQNLLEKKSIDIILNPRPS